MGDKTIPHCPQVKNNQIPPGEVNIPKATEYTILFKKSITKMPPVPGKYLLPPPPKQPPLPVEYLYLNLAVTNAINGRQESFKFMYDN